ncbi:MAG TPA: hypothetical protein PKH58_10165 [Paludibacteraceae bacterium]|nr:hypothetical protein [Paludibacteraceae bacterium]
MKTKIRTISLMLLGVFILTFWGIKILYINMPKESLKSYKVCHGAGAPTFNSNEFMMKIPAYKEGSTTATRHRPANISVNRQSAGNVYVPIKSVDKAISSGFSMPGTDKSIYSLKSKKSSDENSLNFRPMALMLSLSVKPTGTMNLVTSGKNVESELLASNLSAPFSESNISGPMRMDGDGENPPPEGTPIGNGIWVMLLLVVGYALYRKKLLLDSFKY